MTISAVICFDLDGTLVDATGTIHPADICILREFREALFVPASGRVIASVRRLYARHGLVPSGRLAFPAVTQNGTVTYLPGEVLHQVVTFSPSTQAALIQIALETPGLSALFSDANDLYLLWPTEFALAQAARFELPVRPFQGENNGVRFAKMMLLSDQPDLMRQAVDRSIGLEIEGAYSMPIIHEITPRGANKGAGLRGLLPGLRAEQVPVFAIGDGGNDLSLFEAADISFAPASSPPEIQRSADQVVDASREGILTPVLRAAGLL